MLQMTYLKNINRPAVDFENKFMINNRKQGRDKLGTL